jgi:hypothetical protein
MTQSWYSTKVHSRFATAWWSEFYPDADKAIPQDCPMERGNGVISSCVVDADHAGCKATRRLHTGVILLYVNKAPILLWCLKHQNTIETST